MNNLQTGDMPTITKNFYGNATGVNPVHLWSGDPGQWSNTATVAPVAVAAPWSQTQIVDDVEALQQETLRELKQQRVRRDKPVDPPKTEKAKPMATQQRRIVQVFIADTNENVPMDTAILYKGEPKFTDLTDQELYFELPIKELLEKHNAGRVKMLDKDASRKSSKDIYLDAIKVRDLKMVVVEIATF